MSPALENSGRHIETHAHVREYKVHVPSYCAHALSREKTATGCAAVFTMPRKRKRRTEEEIAEQERLRKWLNRSAEHDRPCQRDAGGERVRSARDRQASATTEGPSKKRHVHRGPYVYEKLGTNSRWLASANEHFEKDLLGVVLWSGASGWYTVIEFVFFLRYGARHMPSPRRRYVFKK